MAQARSFFDRALTADPDNVDALVGSARADQVEGVFLFVTDRTAAFATAEAKLTKALSAAPDHARGHMQLGLVDIYTERAAEGIAKCEHALALDRNLAYAHAYMGIGKVFIGRPEETESHIAEALRLSPRYTMAYVWMAIAATAKRHLGVWEEAVDAQREACAAYVRSQAHEGWEPHKGRYDDGGYSGASRDRPPLQALLEEVRKRQIDVIVVYKVDRLTRSLADFAKLIELLDAHGVSFISITQSFNTTTSMGRLTLNMLLSFAQFEREVTGERIRDKIAASKKKGLWVGGVVPLGYKVVDRKLEIDEAEAPIVRLIFERYCALASLIALMRDLREREVVTRVRTLSSGRTIGGIAFTKGPLAYLVKNRMYLGEINHGQSSYAGEHPAIVDKPIFDKAQEILARNAAAKGYSQFRSQALLLGRLYDESAKTVKAKTARRVIKPWTKEDVRTLKAHSKARTPSPRFRR